MDEATRAILDIDAAESRRLRDMPYLEFLTTPYWKTVSRLVRERAHHRCEKCGKSGVSLEAHHRRYKNHGKEHRHLSDLLCWCSECHRLHHVDDIVTRPRRYKERKKLQKRWDHGDTEPRKKRPYRRSKANRYNVDN